MQITAKLQQINGMEIEVMEPLLQPGVLAKLKRALGQQQSVVFLHGFNDPFQNFAKLIWPVYHRGYDVYAFNFPGHGNSEKIPQISWETLTDLAHTFIVEQTPNSNIHLLSFSMGSAISLRLAAQNEGLNLRSLAMVAPYIYKLPFEFQRSVLGAIKLAGSLSTKLVKYSHHLTDLPIMCDLTYLLPRYPFLLSQDPIPQEVSIDLPIVAMVFTGDEVIFADHVEHALNRFPQHKFIKYPGLSHSLYYESPEVFDSIIAQLL